MKQRLIVVLLLMLFLPAATSAHETFVRPISGWVDVGDIAILPIGSGHNTTSTELLEGQAFIKVISQSGQIQNHSLGEKTATDGYWKLYDIDVDESGLYIIDLFHTEGSWTHFITNPPVTGYWEHKYADEIDFGAINTTGWTDDWYVERSYPKLCYAKAFLAGPGSDFSIASKPLGQKLEIVPLDNITTVGKGNFAFQVLFSGQPMDNLTVTAERIGDDTKQEAITDKEGKVTLNLTDPAELTEWLIRTDTGMDSRVVEVKELPRGKNSNEKSYVGPVYRTALTLRNDYIRPVE
jgi:uncharacterized GH25 family protein